MEALKVIITLALFAVLIYAIVKKVNIFVTLMALGVVGLIAATALKGASLYDPSSTGNLWLDVFQEFKTYAVNTFNSSGVGMMSIMIHITS